MNPTNLNRTYGRQESVVFRMTKANFGGLSNMASGFPLEINGRRVWSSEALYQACRFPDLPEAQELIIRQRSPMTAKMVSKRFRKDTRQDWQKVRVTVMRWCLRVKLAQNWEKFSLLLSETGDRPIVEESRKDDFWGAEPQPDGSLNGSNVLGRLLMELREELKAPDRELLRNVDPPDIPNFIFCGSPVGVISGFTEDENSQPSSNEHSKPSDNQSAVQTEGMKERDVITDMASLKDEQGGINHVSWVGIPKECKRLAEVDFPVAEVSRHSAREKSIRHGHPSTLHLWWARRPLAACRAMLMALLLPDPCDEHCPEDFKKEARQRLKHMPGGATVAPVSSSANGSGGAPPKSGAGDSATEDLALRKALLSFIADFANWDNSAKPAYLDCARGLVKAAHGEDAPLVVDPFAGGGSIPLEALRVGCDAFASDLNPVACLILKVLLEDIPRHGPALAEELRRVGKQIKEEAEKELGEFYPPDPDGARPIAYLWARTVRCEAVGCGAEIPLMRSFWLCRKTTRRIALRLVYELDSKPMVDPLNTLVSEKGRRRFEIYEPSSEAEVEKGTAILGNARCPVCNVVLPRSRVQAQLVEQRGGAEVVYDSRGHRLSGARILAVVSLNADHTGRRYRLSTARDYECIRKVQLKLHNLLSRRDSNGQSVVPTESLPSPNGREYLSDGLYYNFIPVVLYGMRTWRDLFTPRQLLALSSISQNTEAVSPSSIVARAAAMAVGRCTEQMSSLVRWRTTVEAVAGTFGRQALPMMWDFAEIVPIGDGGSNFGAAVEWVAEVLDNGSGVGPGAEIQQADACMPTLPNGAADLWFTDPPYYDAIPYADLSDFFLVWLKRTIPSYPYLRDTLDPHNPLAPKSQEIIDTLELLRGAPKARAKEMGIPIKDRQFFEGKMAKAFAEGQKSLNERGIGCVVFAHKTTEGWEALLGGLKQGGWVITTSWPIATERPGRLRAQKSAALATSVHLVCRPRPENAGIGGWEDILRELPNRIGDWMERLSGEGIRGADLVFSCIGPALELFSKYEKVETAEGREVKLPEFLEKVWEVVGRTALQQILGTAEARARNGAAGALEEDARLTALFLWTLQSTSGGVAGDKATSATEQAAGDEESDDEDGQKGKAKKGFTLIYDVARRFAQPLGIHLPNWEGRIIETSKGVVRLIPVLERGEKLFGEKGSEAIARAIERSAGQDAQFTLFPDQERVPDSPLKTRKSGKGRRMSSGSEAPTTPHQATTLDRVHAAMLLQASGQAAALRTLLEAETQRSPDFLRLANALSALYPKYSEEKRLLDAMLLAVPR